MPDFVLIGKGVSPGVSQSTIFNQNRGFSLHMSEIDTDQGDIWRDTTHLGPLCRAKFSVDREGPQKHEIWYNHGFGRYFGAF